MRSFIFQIKKLGRIFDRGTKLRLAVLLAAIIFGGFLETIGLSLIALVIAVAMDSSAIYSDPTISRIFNFLGLESVDVFLVFATFATAALHIFRGVYQFWLKRANFRFMKQRQTEFSVRLLRKILDYSYLYHTHKNTAELMRMVQGDVAELFSMLNGIITALTDFFMMLFILIFLMLISPLMTLGAVGLMLVCLLLYFKAFRKRINVAGNDNRRVNIGMSKSMYQALGGIKEIKLLRREGHFHNLYAKFADESVDINTRFNTLNAFPKLVVEIVCFGGAFFLLGLFILSGAEISDFVTQLGIFVVAAFRMLPVIVRQVGNINSIMYANASVNAAYHSFFEEKDIAPGPTLFEEKAETTETTDEDIVVQNVTFKYPGSAEPVLENIYLTIPGKKSVAFIGSSGFGKTTLADLILGILSPDGGGVFYKGQSIHQNFEMWSKKVGYIPQFIYLMDESILENIGFGLEKNKIDEKKAWNALEKAQLADFVKSLPNGIKTVIGERGVRLSGGQRQRIGIARALYEDPTILVLDEATSSLDDETEAAIMEAIEGFHGEKTIIIVAHRLSTIKGCDVLYRVENKTVSTQKNPIAEKEEPPYKETSFSN